MVLAEPWLPPAADGAVETALRKIVDGWQKTWFSGLPKVKATAQSVPTMRQAVWHELDGAFVGQMRNTLTAVGLNVCGGQGHPHNPRDSVILAKVGREAIDDLVTALGFRPGKTAAKFEDLVTRKGLLGFSIASLESRWSISLALNGIAQTSVRKLAAQTRESPVLGTFENALRTETSSVGAHLGRSKLNSGEIAALGIGDVIVFDRKISHPAPLEVSGTYPKRGSATIVKRGDFLGLTLTSEISIEASETAPI